MKLKHRYWRRDFQPALGLLDANNTSLSLVMHFPVAFCPVSSLKENPSWRRTRRYKFKVEKFYCHNYKRLNRPNKLFNAA